MRTCKDLTRLALESQDRRLRPLESASLRLHRMICDRCRHFHLQQQFMRVALDRWKVKREGE